ncbi:MAG: PEP-CTERM sorting domain-containing protein [Azonexus sp.]|jgi:hypothetical protein|nr:PEP-CTERM sorting domain-containing protein [Azonexus sp.]
MKHSFAKTLFVSLFCAAAAGASAAPVLIKETGLGNGQATNGLILPIQSGALNYWAGFQVLTINDGSPVLAFCVDPWEWTPGNTNQSYDDAGSLDSIFGSKSNAIRELYSEFYASTLDNTTAGDRAAAGFQLALWEIIADDDFTLDGSGSVATVASTNQTIVDIANDMLGQLDGVLGGDNYSFTFYTSGKINGAGSVNGFQDYLVASKIPEPGSALLLLTALGSGLLIGRRRQQADA